MCSLKFAKAISKRTEREDTTSKSIRRIKNKPSNFDRRQEGLKQRRKIETWWQVMENKTGLNPITISIMMPLNGINSSIKINLGYLTIDTQM